MATSIKAKFAGTCTRTGKSYAAGTLIMKGKKGWEIDQSAAAQKAAAPGPIFTAILTNRQSVTFTLLNDGRVAEPLSTGKLRPWYSAAALEQPDFDKNADRTIDYCPQYQVRRDGDAIVCPVSNELKGWVEGTESEWLGRILPGLYFHVNGELSMKVGPSRWEKIKQYFEYTSYADKADWLDQMDEFEEAALYEKRRGGEWTLKNLADVATVENLLGILPENRFDVVRDREAKEAQARQEAEAKERAERKERERLEAEARDRRGVEFEAFTAEHLAPLVRCDKSTPEGVEWGHSVEFAQGTPGTWYTTGNSYRFGTLNGETLISCSYGNVNCFYASQSIVDDVLLDGWREQVEAKGEPKAAGYLLARWADYGEQVLGGSDTKRLIDLLGREHLEILAAKPFFEHYPSKALKEVAPGLRQLVAVESKEPIVAEIKALANGRLPLNTVAITRREEATGQIIVEVSRRMASGWDQTLYYTPAEFEALPLVHEWREPVLPGFDSSYQVERAVNVISGDSGGTGLALVRFPDGRLVARYRDSNQRPGFEFDLTSVTMEQLHAARDVVVARNQREQEARAIASIRKQATRGGMENAAEIKKADEGKMLDSANRGGTGNGSACELQEVKLTFKDGTTSTAYRASWEWWHLGEDGDADSESAIYADLGAARTQFEIYRQR